MTTPLLDFIKTLQDGDNINNILTRYPHAQDILEGRYDIRTKTLEQLIEILETYAYLGISSKKIIKQIVWMVGENEKLFNMFFEKAHQHQIFAHYYVVKQANDLPKNYLANNLLYNELLTHYPSTYTMEELGCRFCKYETTLRIINSGNTRLFEWAVDNNLHKPDYDRLGMLYAAGKGYWKMMSMMIRLCGCTLVEYFYNEAIEGNHRDLMNWLYENNCPMSSKVMCCAINNGDIYFVSWLLDNKCPMDSNEMRVAVEQNRLDIVQQLYRYNCPFHVMVCAEAAKHGHLELLKWLRSHNCPWDINVCHYAAEYEHMELLQWAHQNGCPWDSWTTALAAQVGNLGILQWLRENGCPWNLWTYHFALEYRHQHIIEWALANGCPTE